MRQQSTYLVYLSPKKTARQILFSMRQLLIILSFIFCCPGSVRTQTHIIDSLETTLRNSTSPQTKLSLLLALCEEHPSLNRDTLFSFAQQAVSLSGQSGSVYQKDLAVIALANAYYRWGWMDSSLFFINPLVEKGIGSSLNEQDVYFKAARLQALCYGGRSDFKNALTILYSIVSNAEKRNDSLVLSSNMNTIGSVLIGMSDNNGAMDWLKRALQYTGNSAGFLASKAAIYTNMASLFLQNGKLDSAQTLAHQAAAWSQQVENLNILASALRTEAAIATKRKDYTTAELALKKMIDVRSLQNNDASMYVDDNLQLIDFYMETGQFQKAIAFCKEKLVQGNIYDTTAASGGKTLSNIISIRLAYYDALAKCYRQIGDMTSYRATLENLLEAKDSFYKLNSAEAIAEMQTRYDVEKKEKTIIQQRLDLTRKNYIFYGSLLFTALVIIFGAFLFMNYRKKQVLKHQFAMQAEKKNTEEGIRAAEEKERKRIAADLHDNLGAYAASISSNLDQLAHASQRDPHQTAMEQLRANADAIVAELADTIWALNKTALQLSTISDRIKVFIRRIQPSYPQVTIEVFEDILSDTVLLPSQAFHLFRIIQEAINNALRHSNGWKIEVLDNGKGFTPGTNPGNGLYNMQTRADSEGWTIQWINTSPGTMVQIIG